MTFPNNTLLKVNDMVEVEAPMIKVVMVKLLMVKLDMVKLDTVKKVDIVDKEVWGMNRKLVLSSIIMVRLHLLLVLALLAELC